MSRQQRPPVYPQLTPEQMQTALIIMKEDIIALHHAVNTVTIVLNAYCKAYPLPGLPGATDPAAPAKAEETYRPGVYI